jgi:hypothetical protein
MKLTAEQIRFIDKNLLDNGVFYEDVKLELIDHIASDIENQMEIHNTEFNEIFQTVFNKWKGLLESTSSSAWLGILFEAPKAVVNKMVSYTRKQFVFIFISALIFGTLIATIVSVNKQEKFFYALDLGLKGLFFLIVLATIMGVFLIRRSTIKTTYGRLFLLRSWLVFLFFYQSNFLSERMHRFDVNDSWGHNFISWFLYGFEFFYSFYHIRMVLKHFETVKKYKLV